MSAKNPSKSTWREAKFYSTLLGAKHDDEKSFSLFPAFTVLDGRKFIDLDDIKEEAGF